MARFYGTLKGQRGEASRLGSTTSGLTAHIRGWDVGARVRCYVANGEDVVEVWATGGSNGAASERLIATLRAKHPAILYAADGRPIKAA